MRSSHVGSFPLSYNHNNVRRVLFDLFNIGIDVPSYPQLRSFVDIYLKPLEDLGIIENRKGVYFSSYERLQGVQNLSKVEIPDAEIAMSILRENKLSFKGFRAPITGVFTLASRVHLSDDASRGLQSTGIANTDAVRNFFVDFVSKIIEFIKGIGYNIVFFDEPALVLIIGRRILFGWEEEDIIEILSRLAKRSSGADVGIHICGPLNKRLFDLVVQVDGIKYYSFEFYSNPRNIDIIDRDLLEKYDKIISPGVVSASKPVVESVEESLNILRKLYDKIENRIDLVSGDCGFGGLRGSLGSEEEEYKVALGKLKVVIESIRQLERKLGIPT
ncbi:MAG: methionine synthase [Ignisphaera sp.]|nr:methionine synthase [Ignisphaera sp.]MCX8167744.1 methionine synthase [Ignisphaera sp.]MDW8085307.1 methionine synthase [Ignisphaera sp.]